MSYVITFVNPDTGKWDYIGDPGPLVYKDLQEATEQAEMFKSGGNDTVEVIKFDDNIK